MKAGEQVVRFHRDEVPLLGIAHVPEMPSDLGVVVIVGGPQYRAGSHRQFVHLARGLAAEGFTTLRFDACGMGDSGGDFPGFEHLSADIGAAIDALQREVPAVRRVVLWGLCDGASAALLYIDETHDARVAGLCLANPWVRDAVSLARTQVKHYYGQRLMQRAFWRKLLRGGVGIGAVTGWLRAWRTAVQRGHTGEHLTALRFQHRMARAWKHFPRPVLLMLSDDDYTAKEFIEHTASHEAWASPAGGRQQVHLAGADHTFSRTESKALVLRHVNAWLRHLAGPVRTQAAVAGARAAAALVAVGCASLGLGLAAPEAQASEQVCGSLANAYGPFDYRTQQHMLRIVNKAHFTPLIEALVDSRAEGMVAPNLDYTLRASPNHHRALDALIRLSQKKKSPQPHGMPRSTECYFERALRFQPDDLVARMLYVRFLHTQQRTQDALRELDVVVNAAGDNGMTHFNAGLLYLDLQAYDQALAQAHRAAALKHPATGLQDALRKQGRWRDPETAVATPAPGAASSPVPPASAPVSVAAPPPAPPPATASSEGVTAPSAQEGTTRR